MAKKRGDGGLPRGFVSKAQWLGATSSLTRRCVPSTLIRKRTRRKPQEVAR